MHVTIFKKIILYSKFYSQIRNFDLKLNLNTHLFFMFILFNEMIFSNSKCITIIKGIFSFLEIQKLIEF